MLITTIERESNDDDLFSKSAAILTAASEVAYHTMNTSDLNAEELRRDNGIPVCGWGSRGCGLGQQRDDMRHYFAESANIFSARKGLIREASTGPPISNETTSLEPPRHIPSGPHQ